MPTVVTGFLGEDNPSLFEALFASKGIADHFVRVPGRTRTGVKIVDEVVQQTTDINMPGAPASPEAIARLLEVVDELAQQCEWFVLAGSLPPGAPPELYATLTERLRAQGKRVALDTSGPALHAGLAAGPTLAKPNIHELEQVTGSALAGSAAIEQAARALMAQYGIELLAISMGAEGALIVDGTGTLLAVPPPVTVASTVGAGDAMVAGLIAAAAEGLALPDAARLATAFAVNTITRVGPNLSLARHAAPVGGAGSGHASLMIASQSSQEQEASMANILGVTACPTGIAHTFMAAEGLQRAASSMGHQVKVETQGSVGAENVLTAAETSRART